MLIRENFPSVYATKLTRAERQINRFEQVMDILNRATASGSIRNTEMKDVKRWASDIASDLWDEKISDVYSNAGKYQSLPVPVRDLNFSIMIMGIHTLPSVEKKLQKTKLSHPMIDAMRELVAELMPLAKTIDSLKASVVKGRAPSTEPPKDVNPNKVVKTCPCCQRAIAVGGGTMVHHGYERPSSGWQTSSCPGINFPPLEVSSAGLKWMIESHEGSLKHTIKLQAEKDSVESLPGKIAGERVTITKDSSRWRMTFESYGARLESDIRNLTADLVVMKKRLQDWKPEFAPEDDSPSP
jgi:hypothetical protein